MRYYLRSSFFVVLLLLSFEQPISAQSIATGHGYTGIDLGITGTTLLGNQNFVWRLDAADPTLRTDLPFSSLGNGLGFLAGGKIGFAAFDFLDIETKIRFQTNHLSHEESFSNLVLDPYINRLRGAGTSSYSLTQSSVGLGIFAHVKLNNALYAIGGADYATFLSNTLSLDQELGNEGNPYYIRTNTHTQSFIDTLIRPKSELLNYLVQVRGSAQVGIGSAFRVGDKNLLMDAELLLSIPFTDWMSNLGKGHLDSAATYFQQPAIVYPKMWYISLTFGIRFPFAPLPPLPNIVYDTTPEQAPTPSVVFQPAVKDTIGGIILSGRVTSAATGDPLNAMLTTVDLSTNKVISTDSTDAQGHYHIHVPESGKYSVTANAPGYLFGSAYFELDPQGRILKSEPDIKLTPTSNGRTRLLVFFEFDKSDLQPSSYPELNRAVDLMKAVPTMQVEIAGYTDSVGTRQYNQALSQQRSNAVRDYLVDHGIARERIAAKGYGTDSPIASNSTDEGRAQNRRVEFVVIKK
jgi:outer membrane protein OmpA-like peptidoglycan-associated protein